MKTLNIIAALSLMLFIGCGGGGNQQQGGESADTTGTQEMQTTTDVRTIEIYGTDSMQFVVRDSKEGISVGEAVGDSLLRLESITAQPGEEIHITLTTISQLPASAMAHNWLLLTMDADAEAFAMAAAQATENNYVPSDMQDQIVAQTGLAAGGETTEVTFTVPEEPGTYDYICTFPGHYLAGMTGDFIVEGSAGAAQDTAAQDNMEM
jgi:azurin